MNLRKYIPFSVRAFINRMFISPKWLYVLFGNSRPISQHYGFDRGEAIDRVFIEKFLSENQEDIKGVCLEVQDDKYTRCFGGTKVIRGDILDIEKSNKRATIIADLKDLSVIPDNTYDSIILTQVLQYIDDLKMAVAECKRVLKKDGVLLVTLPTAAKIDPDAGVEHDYWRFTAASAKFLFSPFFDQAKLKIQTYGNASVLWQSIVGLSKQDVSKKHLKHNDSAFPLIVCIRAMKVALIAFIMDLLPEEIILVNILWA